MIRPSHSMTGDDAPPRPSTRRTTAAAASDAGESATGDTSHVADVARPESACQPTRTGAHRSATLYARMRSESTANRRACSPSCAASECAPMPRPGTASGAT